MNRLLLTRERGVSGSQDALAFQRSLHFPAYFAGKLRVEHIYEGHDGCVNRLGWNADGSLLVSGSDDRRAFIWHYPDVERRPLSLVTEHRANIFGAQFLPCTGDRRIVTGAMDDTVQLHELEAAPAGPGAPAGGAGAASSPAAQAGGPGSIRGMRRRAAPPANVQLVSPRTKVYLSHKDRVKDVKVEPMNPHNFWSGGEDGDVRQYDTRLPNQDKWESPTVLIQVRDGRRTVQVKSLDINKAHPHLMAVAGSDPYIRIYDRRKLGAGTTWKRRGATPPLMELAPPHMPLAAAARHGRSHATYVSFSNRGDKVVTTYHADHAYCFDITSSGDIAALFPQPAAAAPRQLPGRQLGAGRCGDCGAAAAALGGPRGCRPEDNPQGRGASGRGSSVPLPPRAEEAKARGNAAVFERKWSAAVESFSEALYFAPGAALLYALRAEALLRRAWVGDAALALRDCDTAVALDDSCSRAFLCRLQALQELQQYQCALTAVDEYRRRFPGRAFDEVSKLAAQLRTAVEDRRRMYEVRRQQQERRRMQRAAEAMARAPRRMASLSRSPAPAGLATAGGGGGAGAAAAASAPAARRNGLLKSSSSTAAARAGAAADEPMELDGATAAASAVTAAAAAEVPDGQAGVEPDVVGPPPPPPPPEDSPGIGAGKADVAAGPAAGRAATAAPVGGSSLEEAIDSGFDAADARVTAAMPPTPPEAAVRRQPEAAATAAADAAAATIAEQGLGPATPHEVEAGIDGVWEEAEEEAAAAADGGQVDGRRRHAGEGEEEEEEETARRGQSDSEYDSEAEMLSREADGEEEDPDLELFLQYYAQAMELAAGGSGSSGSSGPNGSGVSTSVTSSRPGLAGKCGGGAGASAAAGTGAPPRARHVPGAWGGSPGGRRMLQRYVGQCNVQTDIKEVNFVGADDRVVAAGSDCGRVFLYDADTGAVLRALTADEDVANCVQCHPTLPVLATSGIENVIRLWSPRDSLPAAAAVSELQEELAAVVERNQSRMREGPTMFRPSLLQDALHENPQLLHLFMSQLYGRGFVAGRGARGPGPAGRATGAGEQGEGEDEEDEEGQPEVSCRMV